MVYNLFSISQLENDLDFLNATQIDNGQFVQITPMLNEGQDRLLFKWLPKEILIEALYDYIQAHDQYRLAKKDLPINFDWIRILVSYIRDDVDEHIAATKHRELKNYTVLMDKMLNRDYHDFLDPRIADFLDTIESDL